MENENLNSKELKEVPDFSTELKKLKKIFKNIPKEFGTKAYRKCCFYVR